MKVLQIVQYKKSSGIDRIASKLLRKEDDGVVKKLFR